MTEQQKRKSIKCSKAQRAAAIRLVDGWSCKRKSNDVFADSCPTNVKSPAVIMQAITFEKLVERGMAQCHTVENRMYEAFYTATDLCKSRVAAWRKRKPRKKKDAQATQPANPG